MFLFSICILYLGENYNKKLSHRKTIFKNEISKSFAMNKNNYKYSKCKDE